MRAIHSSNGSGKHNCKIQTQVYYHDDCNDDSCFLAAGNFKPAQSTFGACAGSNLRSRSWQRVRLGFIGLLV